MLIISICSIRTYVKLTGLCIILFLHLIVLLHFLRQKMKELSLSRLVKLGHYLHHVLALVRVIHLFAQIRVLLIEKFFACNPLCQLLLERWKNFQLAQDF